MTIKIVEFTGITGAGKTTLFRTVQQQLTHQGIQAKEAYDVILQIHGLPLVQNHKLKSALVEVLALLPALKFIRTPCVRKLMRLAIQEIWQQQRSLYLFRNVIKRIGVHALLQSIQQHPERFHLDCDLILCDEGILHIAHNLFVHPNDSIHLEQVIQFSQIVPQPDLIVWVTADPEQSIQCILARGHDRVDPTLAAARSFVEQADLTFNTLFQNTALAHRLLKVKGHCDPCGICGAARTAQTITQFLTQSLHSPC